MCGVTPCWALPALLLAATSVDTNQVGSPLLPLVVCVVSLFDCSKVASTC